MNTTYELVKSAKYFIQGHTEDFGKIFELSLNDMYFQIHFIVCDDEQTIKMLEKYFVYVKQNAFLLDTPEEFASWLNENVTQFTADWLEENRRDMLFADKAGAYEVQSGADTYLPGNEIDDLEYICTLENYICNLPEIHRQTALAFYYDDLPMEKLEELLHMDAIRIKKRIEYIEKTLNQQMKQYCKERGYSMPKVDSQKILRALSELAKLYRYPDAMGLWQQINSRTIR